MGAVALGRRTLQAPFWSGVQGTQLEPPSVASPRTSLLADDVGLGKTIGGSLVVHGRLFLPASCHYHAVIVCP